MDYFPAENDSVRVTTVPAVPIISAPADRDRIKWDAYKLWAAYLAGRLGSRHRFGRAPKVCDPVARYICGTGACSHKDLFQEHVQGTHMPKTVDAAMSSHGWQKATLAPVFKKFLDACTFQSMRA